MADALTINVSEEGSKKLIELVGRLDTNTSPMLEEAVNGLYNEQVNDIIVEMGQCEFVSSAGLRVIVAMQKHATVGGSLVFRNVRSDVMDVFDMTGFNKILTFE